MVNLADMLFFQKTQLFKKLSFQCHNPKEQQMVVILLIRGCFNDQVVQICNQSENIYLLKMFLLLFKYSKEVVMILSGTRESRLGRYDL